MLQDDRYFLSGSLDGKLRLWNIPEKKVTMWNEVSSLITTANFCHNGKFAVAGTYDGKCIFYTTEVNAQLLICIKFMKFELMHICTCWLYFDMNILCLFVSLFGDIIIIISIVALKYTNVILASFHSYIMKWYNYICIY